MRYSTLAAAAATLLASGSAAASSDFPSIVIKGSKMFYENNGTQFFIQGVAYQQDVSTNSSETQSKDYTDPLTDLSTCSRDVPYLKKVGTNTIRVYALDPTQSHDDCMNLLQENDIYVIADLSQPGLSINRNDAAWNDDLYSRYTSVVDMMQGYPNTLGFFAGNEVSNQANNTDASAFVKAAVRDMKAYIKAKKYRTIPVGYATNDDEEIRTQLADYFNCGDDTANSIDFWGYNIYSWCGDSSFQESGYSDRTDEFKNYSVPFFFAEYGCNTVQPRKFTEIGSIFGDDMTPYWSGAIMYMYFQEANDYGLVSVSGDNVSPLTDYTYYSKEMASATPTGVNSNSYTPSATKPQDCPAVGATWGATNSPLPPTPNEDLCNCMTASLGCVVSSSLDSDDYGDLFGTVCGLSDSVCAGIAHNATTGSFGAYSMCNSKEQLSFVLDQYYQSQNSADSACDFDGKASTQQASSSNSSCSSLLNEAGSAGTGTVTSNPTGGSTSSRSGSAAPGLTVPGFNWGALQIATYGVVAGFVGVTMVLL